MKDSLLSSLSAASALAQNAPSDNTPEVAPPYHRLRYEATFQKALANLGEQTGHPPSNYKGQADH